MSANVQPPAKTCEVASAMVIVTFMPKGWEAHMGVEIITAETFNATVSAWTEESVAEARVRLVSWDLP